MHYKDLAMRSIFVKYVKRRITTLNLVTIMLRYEVMQNVIQHKCEPVLTLKVLVATIDAQWEGMGDVGSARYEPALLPPCPTIRVLIYSN